MNDITFESFPVFFKDLEPGDIFEFGSKVYMKTNIRNDQDGSVNLSTGKTSLYMPTNDDQVHLIPSGISIRKSNHYCEKSRLSKKEE